MWSEAVTSCIKCSIGYKRKSTSFGLFVNEEHASLVAEFPPQTLGMP